MSYYFDKIVNHSFEDAVANITEALKGEGFGILTEIDVKDTLQKKLNVEFRKYKILGACNPSFAHKALGVEDKIGLLLPCNVVVQETTDGKVEIAIIDPVESMKRVKNDNLVSVASEVQAKLKNVLASL
jgi:uncharacterized protein (DUF302 family)